MIVPVNLSLTNLDLRALHFQQVIYHVLTFIQTRDLSTVLAPFDTASHFHLDFHSTNLMIFFAFSFMKQSLNVFLKQVVSFVENLFTQFFLPGFSLIILDLYCLGFFMC